MTTPTKPTLTPATSLTKVPSPSPSAVSAALPVTLAERIGASNAGMRRPARSPIPWSNSWLPAEVTSSFIALRASIVGWSLRIDDVYAEPPTLSPLETKRVLGFAVRAFSTSQASVAAPGSVTVPSLAVTFSMCPWKSVMPTRSIDTGDGAPLRAMGALGAAAGAADCAASADCGESAGASGAAAADCAASRAPDWGSSAARTGPAPASRRPLAASAERGAVNLMGLLIESQCTVFHTHARRGGLLRVLDARRIH